MKRRGMTLIEVLLAMTIFVFGITSLLGLFHFGGDLSQRARAHGELAPALRPLLADVRRRAWRLDASGHASGTREFRALDVPGVPGFHYDLTVEDASDPAFRHARLRFWRNDPEKAVTELEFLLTPRVPLDRRLAQDEER